MNHLILLPAIVIAAAIFFAFASTVASILHSTGRTRMVLIATAILTITTMATITLQSVPRTLLSGLLLTAAGLAASLAEKGSARIWPLILTAFGAAAAAGLPFM